jgi:hypothetical protein
MNKFHLKIIVGNGTYEECVIAEHVSTQDGAYVFSKLVKEIDKGYVPLGDSGIRTYRKMIAYYPIDKTIIVDIEDIQK